MSESEPIRVRHVGGDEFEVTVRDHRIHVDQPLEDGGGDRAPTPTELFVASLGACVAFYVRRFLSRHDLPTAGLEVETAFTFASGPSRVGSVTMTVHLPDGVPEERRGALLAVARHCTVHNSLEHPPPVTIGVGRGAPLAG
jgi:putative redox protein